MKKIFLALITLLAGIGITSADCPPASTSTSNVVLTQRTAKVGMLNGVFSVASGRKVSFSKGNLQYLGSEKKWRFAENQWDAIGGTGSSNVSPLNASSGNNTAAASRENQNYWIDLFGWATSGNSASGAVYEPWNSMTTGTYGPSISSGEWTAANSDWGVVNAGQLGAGWRTLTNAEWAYLINTRRNADNKPLYAHGIVHNIKGLILLPDGWRQANSAIAYTMALGNSSYANVLSDDNWAALEKEGAVFLPAAGSREGTSVNYAGSSGYYWSSTASSSTYAYTLNFSSGNIYASNSLPRYFGYSVRLVQVIP